MGRESLEIHASCIAKERVSKMVDVGIDTQIKVLRIHLLSVQQFQADPDMVYQNNMRAQDALNKLEDMLKEVDGLTSNDRYEIAVIDHTRDCIMGDKPECYCPRSSVRIRL